MIELLKMGPGTRVEDLGHPVGRAWGLPQGGAFDAAALQRANLLLGNLPGAAALEIASGPLRLRLHRDAWLSLCGADFAISLDGRPQRCAWRFLARAGQLLAVDGPRQGQRALLAVQGGIAGGARTVQAGESLVLGEPLRRLDRVVGVREPVWSPLLRALPAPEYALLPQTLRDRLWRDEFLVTPRSNRMGLRLQVEPLLTDFGSLLSHAVQPGLLQLPPDGQPILLGVDAQATGGYPRLLWVIGADLWKLAQARPGSRLRFARCTPAQAREAWRQQARDLDRIRLALS